MNIITARRTYGTRGNALGALDRACKKLDIEVESLRYLVAVSPIDGRYVPTVVLDSAKMHLALPLVQLGIMVIN